MPLLVLAGGFGTRLRSSVGDVPKPMAPAGGAPFLQHLLGCWVDQGARDFVFLLHHQPAVIVAFLEDQQLCGVLVGCSVRVVIEPEPMGTGGAVAYAVRTLGLTGNLLVANADTWLADGMAALTVTVAPAMTVVPVTDTKRFGAVAVREGRVASFIEKSSSHGSGWINAGLYVLRAEDFASWAGEPFSLETDRFALWAAAGRLGAVPVNAEFIDIGVPDDYFRFCRWIESDKGGAL